MKRQAQTTGPPLGFRTDSADIREIPKPSDIRFVLFVIIVTVIIIMVNIPFGPRTEMPPFTTVYVTPRVGNNVRSGLHDVSDAVRDYAGYARPSHSWQSGGLL